MLKVLIVFEPKALACICVYGDLFFYVLFHFFFVHAKQTSLHFSNFAAHERYAEDTTTYLENNVHAATEASLLISLAQG